LYSVFPYESRNYKYFVLSAHKGTTNIWNTQGFWLKKVNLFVFLAKRLEYSHKRANVLSGECQRQAASEGTTNIWNTQGFM